MVTALLAGVYLRSLGKRSPLQLLQDSERKKEKHAEAATEIGLEDLARASAVLAVPVTVTGKPIRGFLRRYVFRHIRRAGAKTLLALLLAAALAAPAALMTFHSRAQGGAPVPERPEGPCDIYAAGGTPCAAAHSTTRAL